MRIAARLNPKEKFQLILWHRTKNIKIQQLISLIAITRNQVFLPFRVIRTKMKRKFHILDPNKMVDVLKNLFQIRKYAYKIWFWENVKEKEDLEKCIWRSIKKLGFYLLLKKLRKILLSLCLINLYKKLKFSNTLIIQILSKFMDILLINKTSIWWLNICKRVLYTLSWKKNQISSLNKIPP